MHDHLIVLFPNDHTLSELQGSVVAVVVAKARSQVPNKQWWCGGCSSHHCWCQLQHWLVMLVHCWYLLKCWLVVELFFCVFAQMVRLQNKNIKSSIWISCCPIILRGKKGIWGPYTFFSAKIYWKLDKHTITPPSAFAICETIAKILKLHNSPVVGMLLMFEKCLESWEESWET